MKRYFPAIVLSALLVCLAAGFFWARRPAGAGCLTGAFIGDRPLGADLDAFERDYGRRPYFVLTFIAWDLFPDAETVRQIYVRGSRLVITWEPWNAQTKTGIDYEALLKGRYDAYLAEFAARIGAVPGPVFLRFAHEMNGNWYPWSGTRISGRRYVAAYRYVKDFFDRRNVKNVRWVFSVNAEDVPRENNEFMRYYPGDAYVDFFGIDGYNWGRTVNAGSWVEFADIFRRALEIICARSAKPILITEFGSTSRGGDKALWIERAMRQLTKMKRVRGFILFNVDKETDWKFDPDTPAGCALRKALADPYFKTQIPAHQTLS